MKLMRKIIFVIISVATIITALTVVALAAEKSNPYVYEISGAWESLEDGNFVGTNDSGTRGGYMYTEASPSNKYGVITVNPNKGYTKSTDNWYYMAGSFDSTTVNKGTYVNSSGKTKEKNVYKYNLADYSYITYDFDIMTPTGNFGSSCSGMSFRAYGFYYETTNYGGYIKTSANMADTGKTPLSFKITSIIDNLDKTPYNWQHVTLVIRAYNGTKDITTTNENGESISKTVTTLQFETVFYINGVKRGTLSNNATTSTMSHFDDIPLEDVMLSKARFSSQIDASPTKAGYDKLVSFSGYTKNDPTTWPDADLADWYNQKTAIDNLKFSYYKSGEDWDSDSIAAANYEREKVNMPANEAKAEASLTKLSGEKVYYATAQEAVDAAAIGETVTLYADVAEPLKINKAITIDCGIRYKHSSKTYLLGAYDFTWYTESNCISEPVNEADGIIINTDENGDGYVGGYSFRNDFYFVNWDPACDGKCNCHDAVKHLFTKSEKYSIEDPIVCPFSQENFVFKMENGLEITFEGWSRTKGGSIVDVNSIIPNYGEIINLYPVYTINQYSFEVTTTAGATSYYFEDEYATAIALLAKGGTMKLHTDVTVDIGHTFTTANANIVIDLNGHDFKKFSIYNVHYEAVYDEASGTWKKGSAISSSDARKNESGSITYPFKINARNINFTIKNSGAPANLYAYTLCRDLWLDADGTVRGYDNLRDNKSAKEKTNMGSVLFGYASATNTTINILGNGITYYGGSLIYNTWGGNQNTSTFKIDGGTYYVMVNNSYSALIAAEAGGTVDVRNATLVCNGMPFIRVINKAGNGDVDNVKVVDFKFTNCDILDSTATNANTYVGAAGIVLENCRYYTTSSKGLTLGNGTYVNTKNGLKIADGSVSIAANYTKKINLVVETSFTIDESTLAPICSFTYAEKEYTFTYIIADPETDCAKMNWYDTAGEFIESTYALKNSTITLPELNVPSGDGWRGVTNVTTWTDANGNVFNLSVGDADEYNLYPILPPEAEREYTGCVTNAMFNMLYFTNFAYNIYIPKADNVIITDLDGTIPARTVYIYGKEYWVYTTYVASINGLEDKEISFAYLVDGVSYSVKFKPSALFYADTIVKEADAEKVEKELVGSLIRYIEESYKAYYQTETLDDATKAKLDAFYAVYTPDDYSTEYPDAELFDDKIFSYYLEKTELMISGGNVRFVFTLKDSAVMLGYKIKVKGLTGALSTEDGKVFVSDNTPLRTHVMEPFTLYITDAIGNVITVDGENGDKVEVSGKYSLAAYTKETQNPLAKSLYAFGKALREYYPLSDSNYQFSEITLFGENIKNYTIATDVENANAYFAAEEIQALIYNKAGYWLKIVPYSEADKSIVLTLKEKSGNEGFSVALSEGQIEVICEYELLLPEETVIFFKNKLSGFGKLNLTDSDNYTKNIRDIFYSDYGAVGDGITDDTEAIRATHERANKTGQTVCADNNAIYYIGPMQKQIIVRTDVNWGTANFIIDDRFINVEDAAREIKVFNISSGKSATTFSSTTDVVKALNAAGGIKKDTITKIDLGLGCAVMIEVYNDNHRNYIRYGANKNSGAVQHEVVLIDENGNIDPSTPFMFDYEQVTRIIVREIDVKPITIDGGIFTTRANKDDSKLYNSYERNIQVTRPNTTVKNLTHKITDEGDNGAPYGAFLKAHTAYNVKFIDCKVSGHRTYYNNKGVGMGTYDIGATSSVSISWINCIQINMFKNVATESIDTNLWGIMGSSYCKNLSFDGCTLSRFDAHAGVYNVSIKNCEMVHITIVGAGDVTVENTTIYHTKGIQLRTDYGSFWHGDVTLRNISFRNSGEVSLITAYWYNHDFGYPTALPKNITIDGITLKKSTNVYVFEAKYVKQTNDILKDSFEEAVYDDAGNQIGVKTVPNVNKVAPPETITIKNCPGCNIILPDKAAYPFFANCEYITTNIATPTY